MKLVTNLCQVRPKLAWLSFSETSHPAVSAWFLQSMAKWQKDHGQYFVFAVPFHSANWQEELVQDLVQQKDTFVVNVNMRQYNPPQDTKMRGMVCLVHNIPGNFLKYLASTGNSRKTKTDHSAFRRR